MISDNFSPALLTTLKNRHLKAFRGSPAMLWLSCCANRRSLPRGCAPHRGVLVAVLQACHGALHHRSYWLTAWFSLPGVHHLHCLPVQRALHQIACSPRLRLHQGREVAPGLFGLGPAWFSAFSNKPVLLILTWISKLLGFLSGGRDQQRWLQVARSSRSYWIQNNYYVCFHLFGLVAFKSQGIQMSDIGLHSIFYE